MVYSLGLYSTMLAQFHSQARGKDAHTAALLVWGFSTLFYQELSHHLSAQVIFGIHLTFMCDKE